MYDPKQEQVIYVRYKSSSQAPYGIIPEQVRNALGDIQGVKIVAPMLSQPVLTIRAPTNTIEAVRGLEVVLKCETDYGRVGF